MGTREPVQKPLGEVQREYCEAVMNRESEVRYGQVRVKSEQELEIADVAKAKQTMCQRPHDVVEKVLVGPF